MNETQAVNNNGNSAEIKISIIVCKKTTTAASAKKQMAIRVLYTPVSMWRQNSYQQKRQTPVGYSAHKNTLKLVLSLCLGFSAKGQLRDGTATRPTATANITTAAAAVDTCFSVERNAGWIS